MVQGNLPSLTELYLDGIGLGSFENGKFGEKLKVLRLQGNSLHNFSWHSYPLLEELALSSNPLESFTDNDLPNVDELQLDGCNLR